MLVTEAEDRAAVREDRTQPRLLLAHRFKPARDRAVVRTFLRTLGVACAEAELVAPIEAPNELPRSKLRGIKPPLAYSRGPASLAGWMLVYLGYVLHAHLRTTPTGRLGDAVAYSLFHCLAASHIGE